MNKQEKRALVDTYINNLPDEEKNPLIFSDEDGNPANLGIKKLIKNNSIDDYELIRIILRNKEEYYSRNQLTKVVETEPNKHRSSLDIWRHFIFYKPETTIYHVMSLLWEIRSELRYQYCYVVHRRVFDLDEDNDNLHEDSTRDDEYNLKFLQWKELDIDTELDEELLEDEEIEEEDYLENEEEDDTQW